MWHAALSVGEDPNNERSYKMKTNKFPVYAFLLTLGLLTTGSWIAPLSAVFAATTNLQSNANVKPEDDPTESREQSASAAKVRALGDMVKVGADAVVLAEEKVSDLVVVLGNAKVDGDVGGDMVVVHGDAEVNSRIAGDCVVVLGNLKLGPKAQIGGETTIVLGHLDRDPEARLASAPKEFAFEKWTAKLNPVWKWVKSGLLLMRPLPPTSGFAWFFVGLFFLIYLIIAVLMPRSMTQCVTVLDENSLAAFGVGLVALVLFGPLVLLLVASGIGLLVVPFLNFALLAAVLVGKAASFQFIGAQLAKRFGMALAPESIAHFLVGVLLVTVLYMVPILGCVVWGVLFCLGLGVALMAVFRAFRVNGRNGSRPASAMPTGVISSAALPTTGGEGTSSAAALDTTGRENTALSAGLRSVPPIDYASLPRVGFWLRFAATLLDLVLLGWLLGHLNGFGVIFWIAYHVGMWTWKGTTIGGVVCRIRVVREDGRDLDFSLALVRALAAVFSLLAFGIGFFWAGWTRERQSWHDKIAGTIIVKVPREVPMI